MAEIAFWAAQTYRNFKLRRFTTRFTTSINYSERNVRQGEFQTSGFPYHEKSHVRLSCILRFQPASLHPFTLLISFLLPPAVSSFRRLSGRLSRPCIRHSLVTKQFIPFFSDLANGQGGVLFRPFRTVERTRTEGVMLEIP